jgi:hypothetical protein
MVIRCQIRCQKVAAWTSMNEFSQCSASLTYIVGDTVRLEGIGSRSTALIQGSEEACAFPGLSHHFIKGGHCCVVSLSVGGSGFQTFL